MLEIKTGQAVTEGGAIRADHIVVATHFPFLNKFGAYVLGGPAADPPSLRPHAPQAGLGQLMGAQQTRQTSADHQRVGADILSEGLEFRQLCGSLPNGRHNASPLWGSMRDSM